MHGYGLKTEFEAATGDVWPLNVGQVYTTLGRLERDGLVTAEAVRRMRPGSVVVDLAGETGGNCELTVPGETVVRYDVTIASPLNLPATMPEHASELYARNVQALLELMLTEGKITPDLSDEILAACCVTRGSDQLAEAR